MSLSLLETHEVQTLKFEAESEVPMLYTLFSGAHCHRNQGA